MRLVLVSDTHEQHRKLVLPEGDVLVHAGDFTMDGRLSAVADFDDWLGEQKFAEKIVIAGNHDLSFHFKKPQPVLTNATYLEQSSVNIDGVTFYGSPWTPRFGYGWAFNADDAKMKEICDNMTGSIDVLISHGPPRGIGDLTLLDHKQAGCLHMRDAVRNLQPKLHVFGHIHEGYGVYKLGETVCVNASSVDFGYRMVNPPIIFDI